VGTVWLLARPDAAQMGHAFGRAEPGFSSAGGRVRVGVRDLVGEGR
jgi:hypothetical protein